jgi:hypothetical protein
MKVGKNALSRAVAVALTLAVSLLASPPVAPQGVNKLSPELQRVREALDKYRDPVAAVHDGYWSTVGCVTRIPT